MPEFAPQEGETAIIRTGLVTLMGFLTILIPLMGAPTVHSQASLRYSCSAQVFEAFETERILAFREATGINVELYICSSVAAVNRLMNDLSDIASTSQKLIYPPQEHGYVVTTFCKDPLAVIVNAQCPVADISEKQLQGIFSRKVRSWEELGGPDKPILLVVPGMNTAAYLNFERQVMTRGLIKNDIMTFTSTQVVDLVKRFPWSISFITRGAVVSQFAVRTLKINGLGTSDRSYPYHQEFSFVTKGSPVGPSKAFVDFALSESGIAIIKRRGMTPVLP